MNEENDWNGVFEGKPVNQGLLRKVSVDEGRTAVNRMRDGNGLGPDGIPVEVRKLLRMDFNKLLLEKVIPDK